MGLVPAAVLHGLAFSVAFTALFAGGAVAARDFGMHNWPAAIQERYGPQSARGKHVTRVVSVLVGLLITVTMASLMLTLRTDDGDLPGFWAAFLAAGIALLVFNLYDLVVLDWLIIVWWRPAFVMLPGTEGMPEYRDWRFHLVGFGKGIVILTAIALVSAVITVLI